MELSGTAPECRTKYCPEGQRKMKDSNLRRGKPPEVFSKHSLSTTQPIFQWEQIDLNYRPPRYQHVALPLSYAPKQGESLRQR